MPISKRSPMVVVWLLATVATCHAQRVQVCKQLKVECTLVED